MNEAVGAGKPTTVNHIVLNAHW